MKGHVFRCLSQSMTADVTINPLLTPRGLKGAEINVSNVSALDGYGPREMKRLMTLGKTGPALAHGVRNSLNAIHGAVSFISQKYSDEKVIIEFTRIMQDEIARLVEFISMFLAASCADMAPCLVDINAALKKIEKLIFFQLMTRNISSDFSYATVPAALINPFQFDQAVLNIINNAIEAIEADGELKVITALESCSGKDFIVIEVSDDGPGMPADRASAKIAAEKKGKGFGLLLTEEILNNCGGHMDMRSIENKGTAVRLYIPAHAGGGS